MNNNQLNKQRHIFKEIFTYAYINRFEMKNFIEWFFASDYAYKILRFSDTDFFNPISVYTKFVKNKTHLLEKDLEHERIDINIIHYCAFIYVKFFQRTHESPAKILKYLPFDKIVKNYDLYHILSEERVIFLSKVDYNRSLNVIRKYRAKKNKAIKFKDDTKSLFFAQRIYIKLFYYPEIDNLKYCYIDSNHEFLCDDHNLLVIRNASSIEEIQKLFNDETLMFHKFNKTNNVAFIFASKDFDEQELKEIFFKPYPVSFDKLFVYNQNKITFLIFSFLLVIIIHPF